METPETDRTGEAAHIFHALLGYPIPPELRDRWLALDELVAADPGGALAVNMHAIIAKRLDVEAIEFWLRVCRGRNRLGQKIQIMCYLAELDQANYHAWVAARPAPLRAWSCMAWHGARSAWKFVKGAFLVRHHCLLHQ